MTTGKSKKYSFLSHKNTKNTNLSSPTNLPLQKQLSVNMLSLYSNIHKPS